MTRDEREKLEAAHLLAVGVATWLDEQGGARLNQNGAVKVLGIATALRSLLSRPEEPTPELEQMARVADALLRKLSACWMGQEAHGIPTEEERRLPAAIRALSQPEEPRACDSCGPFASVPMCSRCGRLSLGREDLKALDAAAPQPEEEPGRDLRREVQAVLALIDDYARRGHQIGQLIHWAENMRAVEAKRGSGG